MLLMNGAESGQSDTTNTARGRDYERSSRAVGRSEQVVDYIRRTAHVIQATIVAAVVVVHMMMTAGAIIVIILTGVVVLVGLGKGRRRETRLELANRWHAGRGVCRHAGDHGSNGGRGDVRARFTVVGVQVRRLGHMFGRGRGQGHVVVAVAMVMVVVVLRVGIVKR